MIAAVSPFKMKAAMVAKHRRQRALLMARRTVFHALGDLVATTMAKLGAGNDFGCTIGTKFHDVCVFAVDVQRTNVKLFVFKNANSIQKILTE